MDCHLLVLDHHLYVVQIDIWCYHQGEELISNIKNWCQEGHQANEKKQLQNIQMSFMERNNCQISYLSELCDRADLILFHSVNSNPYYTLHTLLPAPTLHSHFLRARMHCPTA